MTLRTGPPAGRACVFPNRSCTTGVRSPASALSYRTSGNSSSEPDDPPVLALGSAPPVLLPPPFGQWVKTQDPPASIATTTSAATTHGPRRLLVPWCGRPLARPPPPVSAGDVRGYGLV